MGMVLVWQAGAVREQRAPAAVLFVGEEGLVVQARTS